MCEEYLLEGSHSVVRISEIVLRSVATIIAVGTPAFYLNTEDATTIVGVAARQFDFSDIGQAETTQIFSKSTVPLGDINDAQKKP